MLYGHTKAFRRALAGYQLVGLKHCSPSGFVLYQPPLWLEDFRIELKNCIKLSTPCIETDVGASRNAVTLDFIAFGGYYPLAKLT